MYVSCLSFWFISVGCRPFLCMSVWCISFWYTVVLVCVRFVYVLLVCVLLVHVVAEGKSKRADCSFAPYEASKPATETFFEAE